jgi:serine/threonine protein kinase
MAMSDLPLPAETPTLPPTAEAALAEQPTVPPPAAVDPHCTVDYAPTDPVTTALPRIPGFEILSVLGRGGMGVVYKARQERLNRLVALKMILVGSHADEEARLRFLAEAEVIAKLQHPNIVQVHEFGTHDGNPYFCLEFVPGGSLDKFLDATPQAPKESAQLVATLADAMQAAHTQGIIHRDLKPANVLLQIDNCRSMSEKGKNVQSSIDTLQSAIPRVTDFGLAKQTDAGSGITASGAIMGTPSYMAPEQAEGKKSVGPAADIYALGAILYECLTGRPPFKAATSLDTILQVLSEEPVPPSRLQPKLPRDLETICLKCLHKEPTRRYPTAAALADDLRCYLDGKPITARPLSRLHRSWRWCRRNPVVASLSFAFLAAVLLGLFFSIRYAVEANENAEMAKERALQAEAATDLAQKKQYLAHMMVVDGYLKAGLDQSAAQIVERYEQRQFTRKDWRNWEWYYQDRYRANQVQGVRLTDDMRRTSSDMHSSEDGSAIACSISNDKTRIWSIIIKGIQGVVFKQIDIESGLFSSVKGLNSTGTLIAYSTDSTEIFKHAVIMGGEDGRRKQKEIMAKIRKPRFYVFDTLQNYNIHISNIRIVSKVKFLKNDSLITYLQEDANGDKSIHNMGCH